MIEGVGSGFTGGGGFGFAGDGRVVVGGVWYGSDFMEVDMCGVAVDRPGGITFGSGLGIAGLGL